ncbi:MAG: peptide chain release factor I [Planctomycetes bacterium RBG_13_60_9]|nr:MAG: peptide chain release factor I [Planctomycetes bacterium RBG_13_60_9]
MTIDALEDVPVPPSELSFKTSRSGGPGGQNVNKLNTRVTVLFDVAGSPSLTEEQKQRILNELSTRIDKTGVMHVVSQKHRSQEANRQAAVERLRQLLREALKPEPVRRKTKAPVASRERRLKEKKHRGALKQQRAGRDWRED